MPAGWSASVREVAEGRGTGVDPANTLLIELGASGAHCHMFRAPRPVLLLDSLPLDPGDGGALVRIGTRAP